MVQRDIVLHVRQRAKSVTGTRTVATLMYFTVTFEAEIPMATAQLELLNEEVTKISAEN